MEHEGERSLPPGVQPYDRLNGVRIGALAGGVVGAGLGLAFGTPIVWIIGGALVGSAGGYGWVRRSEAHSDNP